MGSELIVARTEKEIERFQSLFAGLDRVYGTYILNGDVTAKGKKEGRGETRQKLVTAELWRAHLAGEQSLGITPIRDDATCVFGAVDIDAYQDFDLMIPLEKLAELDIPATVFRSKSGGAHIYLFAKESIPAGLMKGCLSKIAHALGHRKAEIFPKQGALNSEEDCGSWINMPYFGGIEGGRYALGEDGRVLTAEEFLNLGGANRRPLAWFERFFDEKDSGEVPGKENTPYFLPDEIVDNRNQTLFHYGDYLRKLGFKPDTVVEKVEKANLERCKPPLDQKELNSTTNSLRKRFSTKPKPKKIPQETLLVELCKDFKHYRSGPMDEGFIQVERNGHLETFAVDSQVSLLLTELYFKQTGLAPNRQALETAINTLAAQCRLEPASTAVYVRFARLKDAVYLDLCDRDWRAIRITPEGWEVVSNPPVLFRRVTGALPLPIPAIGGSIDAFRPLVNCTNEQWPLIVGWILGVFMPGERAEFAHMFFNGEKGSSKSTSCLNIQALLDPCDAGMAPEPKNVEDTFISASRQGILLFDNLSGCRSEISDAFCLLSRGAAYRTRQFHKNREESVLKAKIPILANGIDNIATRGDLLDRSIVLKLPPMLTGRLSAEEIHSRFKKLHAPCLGAVLTAVSAGLKNVGVDRLSNPPRLQDFAEWVIACEKGLGLSWQEGRFMDTYRTFKSQGEREHVEDDQVGSAIERWAKPLRVGQFKEITAGDLLKALNEQMIDQRQRIDYKHWPTNPRSLAGHLRRIMTALRDACNLHIEQLIRTKDATSNWRITRLDPQILLKEAA